MMSICQNPETLTLSAYMLGFFSTQQRQLFKSWKYPDGEFKARQRNDGEKQLDFLYLM